MEVKEVSGTVCGEPAGGMTETMSAEPVLQRPINEGRDESPIV